MEKYVLMQEPIRNEIEYSGQIVIVDNSTVTGKKKIEQLIDEGYKHIGWIESECRTNYLKAGFESTCRRRIEKMRELFNEISQLADSHMDILNSYCEL